MDYNLSLEEMIDKVFDRVDHGDDKLDDNTTRMYLFSGNIGTGKSTLCNKLSNLYNATIVNKDSLLESMSGCYGKYDSNKVEIYKKVENCIVEECLKNKQSVIIDRLNHSKEERKRFIDIAKKYNIEVIAYDFGSGTEESLERRIKGNRGVPKRVWVEVHNTIKDSYETPEIEEGILEVRKPPEQKNIKYIAFDFDNTIVESGEYPKFNKLNERIVKLINKLYSKLNFVVILWTCRSGDELNEAITYMRNHNIYFDFYNENPHFDTGSNKIFANAYIDDRGLSLLELYKILDDNK